MNYSLLKYLNDYPSFNALANEAHIPASNVGEDEKSYYIDIELPGISKELIKVSYQDKTLNIVAEKEEIKEEKNKKLHIRERQKGKYERRFSFDADIDSGKSKASFKNGVLHITLPKKVSSNKENIIEVR